MAKKQKAPPQVQHAPNRKPGSRTVERPAGDLPDPNATATQQTADQTPPAGDAQE
jgi:hypothetical protein